MLRTTGVPADRLPAHIMSLGLARGCTQSSGRRLAFRYQHVTNLGWFRRRPRRAASGVGNADFRPAQNRVTQFRSP